MSTSPSYNDEVDMLLGVIRDPESSEKAVEDARNRLHSMGIAGRDTIARNRKNKKSVAAALYDEQAHGH